MKTLATFSSLCCVSLLVFLSACDNPKPAALKEGVVWSVRWVTSSTPASTVTEGLYRTDKMNPQLGGRYGVAMYGVLYPSHLEVRFVGTPDSHSQIIPLSQIVWLEFGDGGISAGKP